MATGPEKNRKKIIAAGAALAAVTAAMPFLAHHGEDADAKKPAAQHEKATRDAGVKELRDGLGRAIKFVVQDGGKNKPADKVDSGPDDEEARDSILQDALKYLKAELKNYDELKWQHYRDVIHPDDVSEEESNSAKEWLKKSGALDAFVGKEGDPDNGYEKVVYVEDADSCFATVYANPDDGTLDFVFGGLNHYQGKIRGIEPHRAAGFVNDWLDLERRHEGDEVESMEDNESFYLDAYGLLQQYGGRTLDPSREDGEDWPHK